MEKESKYTQKRISEVFVLVENNDRYMCTVCGFTYDPAAGDQEGGVSAGISFFCLPIDWACPHCGAERDDFVKRTA